MKKTILLFVLFLVFAALRSQEFITIRLSDTDTTGMATGDKVYVAVIIEDASPDALIYGFNLAFWHDQSVITWDGTTANPDPGISVLNPLFPTTAGAMFNVNSNSEMVMLWGDGFTVADLSGVSFPLTIIEFIFTYHGGSCPLIWGEQTQIPGFELTMINGCVGQCWEVTFHVTANGANLMDALVTIAERTIATDENGHSVFYLVNGDYDYTVAKETYEPVTGNFSVLSEDITFEILMSPVGIPEDTWSLIRFYPNPSSGTFYLRNDLRLPDPVEITITDVAGRAIYYEIEKTDKLIEIDLSEKNKGIYLLRVNTGQNTLVKELIIK